MFYKDKCTGCGACKNICPNKLSDCNLCGKCEIYCPAGARRLCGKDYTADELFDIINKDRKFYETSGGGVTFSGGECMLQIDCLEEVTKICHNSGINTAIDTAGNLPWEYFQRILPYTDFFLYDVKCFTESLHISGTGVSNKLILENLERLSESFQGGIIIRIPVIGGFNDTVCEMEKIVQFLKSIRCLKIELLPYHKLGEHKYAGLGIPMASYSTPDEDKMQELRSIFRQP